MKNHIKFFIAISILLIATAVVYLSILIVPELKPIPDKEFPNKVADWIGEDLSYDDVIQRVLSPDRVIFKKYINHDLLPPVTLFMAYYNTLEKAELSHSPIVCFTGQGWDIKQVKEKEVSVNQPERSKIKVNEMVQKKIDTTLITLYWYQSVNRAFANRGFLKLFLLLNRLTGKHDRNAFVRLTAIVPPGKSIEETRTHLYSFLEKFYPKLNGFFI